jgi:tetratricopeptide (TPR) repeat protein
MITKTLGYLLLIQGNFKECLVLKQRELEIVQNLGDRRMVGVVQAEIGEIFCHMGENHQAEEQLRSAISLLQGRSDYEVAFRHRYLGDVLLARGKYEQAMEAYQFSFRFFQANNELGWMLTALTGLSRAELALGESGNAWRHARQALQLFDQIQLFTFFVYPTVAVYALLLAGNGQVIKALELFALVRRQGYLSNSCWFYDLYGKVVETTAADIPEKEKIMAKKRGQALNFNETVQMLLDEPYST